MSESVEQKQKITEVFDAVAGDYDSPALRFFPLTAGSMVNFLKPHSDWKVLDVATGTGGGAGASYGHRFVGCDAGTGRKKY